MTPVLFQGAVFWYAALCDSSSYFCQRLEGLNKQNYALLIHKIDRKTISSMHVLFSMILIYIMPEKI